MKRPNKKQYLLSRLIDAQDGLLQEDELRQLKKEVMAYDPSLWDDHLWMLEQKSEKGVFGQMQDLHAAEPGNADISRFHRRKEAETGDQFALEHLVWSWFRKYVITVGVLLIVVLTGIEMTTTASDVSFEEQMESYFGVHDEEMSELNHWLYEDL
ncbi:hypothetical protein [Natronogracilivirga saccharolytica]|uniref:Uncharacterized protein n=1 Tax=Natronogracilivirga saccharolytica TaxID=2812953 RepID=A0A8J7RHD2_9BACT|nr:hypothetical protein [Natronogracilivirga saccharolytica]MBP3191227.1 hypothetical protein [Natronogracilivirga saccharolytica]